MAEHAFAQTDNSGVNEESLRMVSATPIGNEPVSDEELRPHVLDGFIGQPRLKAQLQLFLDAARKREVPPDHILLAGPPGLGKTTLAMIVANELAVPIRVTSGPAIQHAGDLASILSSLDAGEVLFIDEIHRLPRAAEELLYIAMEDFRVDVMVGKGPGATSIPLTLPRFTVIGATTREGMLPSPLRARFGFTAHLDFYPKEELEKLIERSAAVLSINLAEGSAAQLAMRSRGTPRIANRLLRRVRDWAVVHDLSAVQPDDVCEALALYQIDHRGTGPARHRRAERHRPSFQRRPRGPEQPLGHGGRGVRNRGDGLRAVSGARGLPDPHAEGARGHRQGMGASGAEASG